MGYNKLALQMNRKQIYKLAIKKLTLDQYGRLFRTL